MNLLLIFVDIPTAEPMGILIAAKLGCVLQRFALELLQPENAA
jgi:hypothetical protein